MCFWWLPLDIISVVLILLIINKAIHIQKLTTETTENKQKLFHIRASFSKKLLKNAGIRKVNRKAMIEIVKKIECFFIVILLLVSCDYLKYLFPSCI